MSYSQNNEEGIITSYFNNRTARFLDIGAHDGVSLSNTRRLAELGWGGVLIEPSPTVFPKLMKNYHGRDDVQLVNAAVLSSTTRFLPFHVDVEGGYVSTFDDSHRRLWAARGADGRRPPVEYQPVFVSAVSVDDLLNSFPGPYAFINLDVEGANVDVFEKLYGRLQQLQVEMMCIEHQNRVEHIERLAGERYEQVGLNSENVILARRR